MAFFETTRCEIENKMSRHTAQGFALIIGYAIVGHLTLYCVIFGDLGSKTFRSEIGMHIMHIIYVNESRAKLEPLN